MKEMKGILLRALTVASLPLPPKSERSTIFGDEELRAGVKLFVVIAFMVCHLQLDAITASTLAREVV